MEKYPGTSMESSLFGERTVKPVTTVCYEIVLGYGSYRRQINERLEGLSYSLTNTFLQRRKPGVRRLLWETFYVIMAVTVQDIWGCLGLP